MKRAIALGGIATLAVVLIAGSLFVSSSRVRGATFATTQDLMTSLAQGQTSGANHTIMFTVPSGNAAIEGRLLVSFPLNENGTWCRVPGGDINVVPSTVDAATGLPGTLAASCTQGNGTSTYDTITLTGLTDLSANTKYGFTVSDGTTAKLGTPSNGANHLIVVKTQTNSTVDIDSGSAGVALLPNDTISISAIVPSAVPPDNLPATVTFQGYAYPNASIRILKDGVQVATGTAGSNAAFSVVATSLPGSYTFSVIGQDLFGRDGELTNVALTLTSGGSVSISNMMLSPTIDQDKTSIVENQSIVFSGVSVPGSAITLTVESTPINYTTTANAQGQWSVSVPGTDPGVGSHIAKATSVFGSLTSNLSTILTFVVGSFVVNQCDGKVASDINCDGKVNLVDFSIMLYFWQATNPANARADVDGDTKVDETDFSILLFYWTG